MANRQPRAEAAHTLFAALSGGFSAILGGLIFVAGLIGLDIQGLGTLAAADGWVRPLAQLGGVVGCFGMIGFALGPIVAATSRDQHGGRDR